MPYLTRHGVRLHYTDAGIHRRRQDPPFLLVHGWTCHLGQWSPLARALRRRHRVVAVDLRGHGRSDAPPGDYTMESLADDLAWLMRRLRLPRPIVVGHSMGGVIALRLAADYPRALRAIVMLDAPVHPDPPAQRWRSFRRRAGLSRAAALDADFARRYIRAFFRPDFDQALADREAARSAHTPPHVIASAMQHLQAHDNAGALEALSLPALYIAAGTTGLPTARIREALTPRGVWFGETVGSGHFVQLESPQQVNAMLQRFLRSL